MHLRIQLKSFEDGKRHAEADCKKATDQLRTLESRFAGEHTTIVDKLDAEIRMLKDSVLNKTQQVETLGKFRLEREQLTNELVELRKNLEKEKADHKFDFKTLEGQMFESTERIRKEMMTKLAEAKAQSNNINDERLDVASRLAILHTHQLNTELQFQCKQSEKIIEENNKLQETVANLKRELGLHKEVEGEMAKKCHFYQKTINKMSGTPEKDSHKKEDSNLIQTLGDKLTETQEKYEKSKNEYHTLQTQYGKLQVLTGKAKNASIKAGILLMEFLESMLNSHDDLAEYEGVPLNIKKLYLSMLF